MYAQYKSSSIQQNERLSFGRPVQNKDQWIKVDRKWLNFQTGLIESKKYLRRTQAETNINIQDKLMLAWLN